MHQYSRVSRNNKVAELKRLSHKELIDRVMNYPDQERLNYDEEGVRRKFPLGYSAKTMAENGYKFPNDASYHGMVRGFASITTPDIKVVGVTFRKTDLEAVAKTKEPIQKGAVSYYRANYRLVPEPDNPYDENAIKVEIENENGEHQHIGYIPREMAEKYELDGVMDVEGAIIDFSNGKMKNVSYRVPLDTEKVNIRTKEKAYNLEGFDASDLKDLEKDKGLQQ